MPPVAGFGETEITFDDQERCSTFARTAACSEAINRSCTGMVFSQPFAFGDAEIDTGQMGTPCYLGVSVHPLVANVAGVAVTEWM